MTYGLWLSAAGMQANQYRQEVLANNLANVNTVGFKRDLAVMRARQVESRSGSGTQFGHNVLDDLSGGTSVTPTHHSFEPGPLVPTGNPLDLAIQGDGFFAVEVDGQVRYTRDGRFTINSDNELVMVANEGRAHVLDEAGAPIVLLPGSAGSPEVGSDGTLRQGRAVVARIGLREFADRSNLRKVGANLFAAGQGDAKSAVASNIAAGTIEGSTVDPISGMASMIEVSRAYQLNAQMISLQDNTLGQAISRLGRIA
ncbi:MAG: flagellar hook-basal body protein [Phycisphaerae bacterium]